MSSQTLTIALPEAVVKQIRKRAKRAKRSLEAEVVGLLTNAIGSESGLPADIEKAIAGVAELDDRALRAAVKPIMTPKQSKRLAALNYKAQDEGLTAAERLERAELLHVYDKSMLVRAAALAELHKRGVDVSALIKK